MQPIDMPRRRGGPSKQQKAKQEFAADAALNRALQPAGVPRPAWFCGEPGAKDHLPKAPPTRTGRP